MLVYDVEIEKLIPDKKEPNDPKFEYCNGWGDHSGMGISIVGAYDFTEGVARIFMKDNLHELFKMMDEADRIVGFNNESFDDKIIAAAGYDIPDEKSWDLYHAIKDAADAGKYAKGYNLDNCCWVNLGMRKSGHGEMAPKLWQMGHIGTVVDYCLRDIMLTYKLLEMAMAQPLLDPGGSGNRIFVKSPL